MLSPTLIQTIWLLFLNLVIAITLAYADILLAVARPAGEPTGVEWPAVSLGANVTPTQVPAAGIVTYHVDLANAGDVPALDVRLNFSLPAGFRYIWGSARIARDGILISSANPAISGNTLTWSNLTVPARRGDSFYGINTMVQERCNISYISWQLDHTRYLMGYAGWAKQLFYGITISSNDPPSCWIDYINAAYDRGLKPVIRLQGEHGGSFWHKPPANWPGNYTDIAQAFARVVSKLPRRAGHRLYIQIWNEPNLNLEWGGAANPTEYGQFLEQTAGAIRTITGGDSRIVILNAPLAPGGDISPITFMAEMFRTVPNSRWAFDIWAAHSYPGNYPPELNIHRGQAVRTNVAIDSYVPEIQTLAAWGRPYVPIFLSETGYLLSHQPDRRYPAVTEALRADYMSRAFQYYWHAWPELIGVAPYELSDPIVAWSGWNWVEEDNGRHAQYDAVLGLDKSHPYVASQLTISFQAGAASLPGTYVSNIEATAANTTITGLYGAVPVTVCLLQPTSTPTRAVTPTATPTRTATATPSSTRTPSPTFTQTFTPTPTRTATAFPSPTATATVTPWPTSTPTATASTTQSPTPTPTRTPPSTPTPTATHTPTFTPVAFLVRTVQVGQRPHGVAVDSHHNLVYVANHLGGTVSVVDGSTGMVVRTFSLGSVSGGNGVALDPVVGVLYVANKYTGDVSRVLVADGIASLPIAVGPQPDGMAVDPATGLVYVANFAGNTISILDGLSGTVLRQMPAGGEPSFIALDRARGRFYVTHHLAASVGIYALESGRLLNTIPTGDGPYGITLDPTRNRLYTANRDDRSVTIVDLVEDRVVKHMPLNCAPYQVAVNPASGHLFVLCGDEQQLHIYERDTTLWLGWVPVGRGAREGLAVDSATGRVYVSNSDDDSLSIIQDSGPAMTPTPLPTPQSSATSSPTGSATPTMVPSTSTHTPTSQPSPSASPTRTATLWPTSTPTWPPAATATLLPGKPDPYEPDDTAEDARLLLPDGSAQEHTFHRPGDVDWVRLEAMAGLRYLIEVLAVAEIEPAVAIFGSDGQLLAELAAALTVQGMQAGMQGSAWRLVWRAPMSDLYYWRISERQDRGDSNYFYTLAVTALPYNQFLPLVAGPSHLADRSLRTRFPGHAALAFDDRSAPVHALTVDPISGSLYLLGGDTLTLYDPAREQVLARAAVGKGPRALLLEDVPHSRKGGRRIFVASRERGAVLALDASTLEEVGSAGKLREPGGLAMANGHLFAADAIAGTVHLFDLGDLHPVAVVEVGPGPYALATLPALSRTFVALTGSDEIAVLDSRSGNLLAVTPLGGLGHPQGMVADEIASVVYAIYALAPRYHQIAILDGYTGAVKEVIPATLDHPMTDSEALALTRAAGDPSRPYLLVGSSQGIMIYDLARHVWVGLLSLAGRGPLPIFGLAVDSRRGVVYAANIDGQPNGWSAHRILDIGGAIPW